MASITMRDERQHIIQVKLAHNITGTLYNSGLIMESYIGGPTQDAHRKCNGGEENLKLSDG